MHAQALLVAYSASFAHVPIASSGCLAMLNDTVPAQYSLRQSM